MSFFKFRKNKRFVNSTFRGARVDTFPGFLYPKEGLLGFWTEEQLGTYEQSAEDFSDEENSATLKTGRGISLDGTDDYIVIDAIAEGVSEFEFLVKSNTDTTIFFEEEGGSLDKSTTLIADGTWQLVSLKFGTQVFEDFFNEITTNPVRLGVDGSSFFQGSIARLNIYRNESVANGPRTYVDTFYFNDHSGADLDELRLFGTRGNTGYCVGCSSISQQEHPVPQLAGVDWQEYTQFDGVDDYISIDGMTSTPGYFGACEIEVDVYIPDITDNSAVCALGLNCYFLGYGSGFYIVNGNTVAVGTSGFHNFRCAFDSLGRATDFIVDGATIFSGLALTGGSSGTKYYIGASSLAEAPPTTFNKNLIYNFSLSGSSVKNFAFKGYGLNPWEDTTGGGNNGVENGSPGRILATSHRANSTDTIGNPFELSRQTSTTFNVPSSGTIEIADIVAYNSVQTVMFWFYHDETDKTILDLGTPEITVASDVLSSSGITAPTYYVDGSVSTAISAGWNFIAVTTATAFNAGPIVAAGPLILDKIAFYSDQKALTDIFSVYNLTNRIY